LRSRQIDLVDVETPSASPYAASLLFDYVANYMYEDDTPAAERRAQALSLDRDLLKELLGQEELRDLIDPAALADVEERLRGEARSPDELHDLLRRRGDLREGEYPDDLAEPLLHERRAVRVRVAGERRLIAAEDAGRYRDAVGAMPPGGLPEVFLEADDEPLHSLLRRFARSGGAFTTPEANERFARDVEPVLRELERRDDLVLGELRPGGTEREWCDPEILRRLRRASLAALRREVEPAGQAALRRFLASWHWIRASGRFPAELARDRPSRVTTRGIGAAAGARFTGRLVGERRAPPARARLPPRAARRRPRRPRRRPRPWRPRRAVRCGRGRLGRCRPRPRHGLLPRGRAGTRPAACRRPAGEGDPRTAPRRARSSRAYTARAASTY